MLEAHFKVYYASAQKNKLLRLLDMMFTLRKRRRELDVVIISVYSTLNFYFAYIIALMCRYYRKPYIAYLHGGNLPFRLRQSPLKSAAIFRHSYRNVAPSAYLKAAFESAGYPSVLIPNFIELDDYPFKQRHKLQPHLLWVRSFEKTYHPEMTVRVFAELCRDYPHAKLCMVGANKDGSLAICRQLVRDSGLEKQVSFPGKLSREAWIARSADYDIFINSTRFDNTPVSVLEAMALGLAVVSTNVGGIPFLLDHDTDALLSPDADIPAMVQNIKKLLEHPELSGKITKNARLKVAGFDWKVVEKQWLELLEHAG